VNKDPDLPMLIEAKNSLSKVYKIAFFICLSIVYALRPVVFMPQRMLPS
jgi:hypothetical protein